jgi:hypothetical protein
VGARFRLSSSIIAVAASLACGPVACKSKGTATLPPAPSAKVADHLARGELPEGSAHAYTLPLPLRSQILASFINSIDVGSEYSVEDVASFTRARVKDGRITAGANETRFDNVVVKSDPSRVLTIEILTAPPSGRFRSEMLIRDVTPPPLVPGENDADRWRKAGLTPDGKLLDPRRMQ